MIGEEQTCRGKAADLFRFLIAGGMNTLLTVSAYQLLLFIVTPQWAYALSWIAGVAFVMTLYPSRVFIGGRSGMVDRVKLGLFYLGIYLIGFLSLDLATRVGASDRLAIIFVIPATTLANFFAARLLLRRPRNPS